MAGETVCVQVNSKQSRTEDKGSSSWVVTPYSLVGAFRVFGGNFFFVWLDSPIWAWAWASSLRRGFMVTHIRHTTVGRTPLDE
jgi:hypothetical protein